MKGVLEFNLDDFDDEIAYQRCIKAKNMALAIWEIQINTKKDCHAAINVAIEENDPMTNHEVIDLCWERILMVLSDNGINTDELIN